MPFYAENRSATPPDPQEVADAVASVIAQPAGERPLRTVVATVAQRQAPQALNDAATQAMQSFLEALHIPLATLAIKGEKTRMKAIGMMTFGGPEVLHVVEFPEPHAGAGEVRIRVHAVSVNPTDTLFRAGSQADILRQGRACNDPCRV